MRKQKRDDHGGRFKAWSAITHPARYVARLTCTDLLDPDLIWPSIHAFLPSDNDRDDNRLPKGNESNVASLPSLFLYGNARKHEKPWVGLLYVVVRFASRGGHQDWSC